MGPVSAARSARADAAGGAGGARSRSAAAACACRAGRRTRLCDRRDLSTFAAFDLTQAGRWPRAYHHIMAENMTMTTNLTARELAAEVARILAAHATREGALLPILHDIQAALGHVPEAVIPAIAHALNVSRAEVHGVISFYHDFHVEHDPLPVIRLCRAESCQARGVEALAAAFAGETRVRIEPIYCLGLCTVGPNAMIGGMSTTVRISDDALAIACGADAVAAAFVAAGCQVERVSSWGMHWLEPL
eukprot:gene9214-11832_t